MVDAIGGYPEQLSVAVDRPCKVDAIGTFHLDSNQLVSISLCAHDDSEALFSAFDNAITAHPTHLLAMNTRDCLRNGLFTAVNYQNGVSYPKAAFAPDRLSIFL